MHTLLLLIVVLKVYDVLGVINFEMRILIFTELRLPAETLQLHRSYINSLPETKKNRIIHLFRYDNEEPKYDYNNPGFTAQTGHFTQVNSQPYL